jgi:hypothetical protein
MPPDATRVHLCHLSMLGAKRHDELRRIGQSRCVTST